MRIADSIHILLKLLDFSRLTVFFDNENVKNLSPQKKILNKNCRAMKIKGKKVFKGKKKES